VNDNAHAPQHRSRYLVVANEEESPALAQTLASWGDATTVTNGNEVAVAIENARYSALVLSLDVRGISGFEVLRAFRHAHPKAPALVIADRLEATDSIAACTLKAHYVAKPVPLAALEAFVAQAFSFDDGLDRALERWRTRYSLTSAEINVLGRVARGEPINTIVHERNTTRATVIVQLGSVRHKVSGHSYGDAVVRLLREVASGHAADEPSARRISGVFREAGVLLLSERERDVVERVARGESKKDIARVLGIADSTVRTLVRRATAKLREHVPEEEVALEAQHDGLEADEVESSA
jgi:DNA-binding NarL/FixJ family response regulator